MVSFRELPLASVCLWDLKKMEVDRVPWHSKGERAHQERAVDVPKARGGPPQKKGEDTLENSTRVPSFLSISLFTHSANQRKKKLFFVRKSPIK